MKSLLVVLSATVAAAACADTFTWTGAADAYWTNAANWTVSGAAATRAPGALVGADAAASWANFDADDDAAVFSGDGNGHTTIDLDGLFCAKEITVDNAPAVYTFGTAGQDLPMRVGGAITLTAGSGCAPAFGGRLLVGKGATRSANYTYAQTNLRNDSTQTFSVPTVAFAEKHPTSAAATFFGVPSFYGNGPFRLAGDIDSWYVKFYFSNYGKVTVDASVVCFAYETYVVNSDMTPLEIEILKDRRLGAYNGGNTAIYHRRAVNVSGEGTFSLVGSGGDATYLKFSTYPLRISSRFDCLGDLRLFANDKNDSPTLEFLPGVDNAMTGGFVWYGCAFKVRTPSIGTNGVQSALGSGEHITLGLGGRLIYTGGGETTTRSILLKNGGSDEPGQYRTAVAGGFLVHEGTGDWTVDSPLTSEYASTAVTPKFGLENSTAYALTLNSAIPDGVTPLAFDKSGTGLVRLGGASAFTGAATVTGGTLAFASGASADAAGSWTLSGGAKLVFEPSETPVTKTLKELSVSAGVSTMTVGANVTVFLDALPTVQAGGAIDVMTADGGKLVCPSAAGQALPYGVLRINHQPAAFDENGELVKSPYVPSATVDVRGGVIPNDATATVGIVDAGEAGNITLGATATAVDVLVQGLEEEPATVELSAGQTLSANVLALKPGATNLTIGADRTTGAFAVPEAGLLLDADSSQGELAVRTPLASAGSVCLTKLGVGLAEVPSAAAFTGRATLYGGTLAFSSDAASRVTTARPEGVESTVYDVANTAAKLTITAPEDGLVVGGTSATTHPLALTVPGGSAAQVTGSGTALNVSDVRIGSAAGAGALAVDGGAEVVFDVNGISVGGEMTVSNATVKLVTPGTKLEESNVIKLGWSPSSGIRLPGRLVVEDGGAVTGRVIVGYANPGALIVNGGDVCMDYNLGGKNCYIGYSSSSFSLNDGYVRVNGGKFTYVIYTSAYLGNMDIAGDVCLGNAFTVTSSANKSFHLRITDGTVSMSGTVVPACGAGNGVITLDGSEACFTASGYKTMQNTPDAGCTSVVNINAGTWDNQNITKKSGAAGKVFVNLNGGTILTSLKDNPIVGGVDRTTVYENGVTIRIGSGISSGKTGASFLSAPGKGVTGIVGFVPLADRVTPPCVIVEGDGEGATAAPLFDEKAGTLTGVRITSHGWNYTWAKVHLVTHAASTVTNATYDCVLAPNRRGGLTAEAEAAASRKELVLSASNEFARVTVRSNVQVTPQVAGAIPTDADIVMDGGLLYMGTNALAFGSISGTGGTIRGTLDADNKFAVTTANPGTGLSGVTFMSTANTKSRTLKQTCNGAWAIDAADLAAGKTVRVPGELAFGPDATLTITGDVTQLDPGVKYTVFEATDGAFEGLPTLTNLPDWKIRKVGSTIRLSLTKGMLLIVR